ncbi:DUF2786 domain-containing protein [Aspergillus tanneri]|uniref:DUF2786 domain-containing protein n=1 Tax=Aspergillus tanneri TaxID=1220188 RepID=A0A5M9N178_9EURO|nr:uncharacterized protein ATNIH1004_000246 [Aspergillus tanneri]KAA8651364.1 hypothetical protein ATNIH1004_000246 [Aspergillus tanneri]
MSSLRTDPPADVIINVVDVGINWNLNIVLVDCHCQKQGMLEKIGDKSIQYFTFSDHQRNNIQKATVEELAQDKSKFDIVDKDILDRIEGYQNKTGHETTTESEAKIAFFVAQKLMSQYNVAHADLRYRKQSAVWRKKRGIYYKYEGLIQACRERDLCPKNTEGDVYLLR